MEISKAEFRDWKENKITQFIFDELVSQRERLKTDLGNGITISNPNVTVDYLVGRIQGISDLLNIEYEEPK